MSRTGSQIMSTNEAKLQGHELFRKLCGKQSDDLYRVQAFLTGLNVFAPLSAQSLIHGCIEDIKRASDLLNQVLNGADK